MQKSNINPRIAKLALDAPASSRANQQQKKQKWYAVRKGRDTGVFRTWAEAKPLVDGYSGAEFKSFKQRADAVAYVAEPRGDSSNAKVDVKPTYQKRIGDGSVTVDPNITSGRIVPTPHQKKAANIACKLLNDEDNAVLRGYAGTGKTTLLKMIVDFYQSRVPEVYLATPTHKACKVLAEKTDREVCTLASLLGLRPKPDGKGGEVYVVDRNAEKEPMKDNSLLVVDEASMVNRYMKKLIDREQKARSLKVLWVGDPAQLPPVGEDVSPALQGKGFEMTEVIRQSGDNPILELVTDLRTPGSPVAFRQDVNAAGRGVHVHTDAGSMLKRAGEAFQSAAYEADSNHARILAWTNRCVGSYNQACRQIIYGERARKERFIPGEWLISYAPWGEGKSIVINNSEEMKVLEVAESFYWGYKAWRLLVKSDVEKTIYVLHEDAQETFEARMEDLKTEAINGQRWKWREYYELKGAFADVQPAFAMTVHKSQGSTFTNTYFDYVDARRNRDQPELKKLCYVAASRPSGDLHVRL